jgi:hypothetical protein
MKDLEYSMVDVSLAVLSYSKGRWTPEEVLEFAFMLEGFYEEETDEPKPTLAGKHQRREERCQARARNNTT